ncbi:hypothetical protein F4806DRAFT_501613 [Annulohypoxylon nitens]|nr:hypothetical protein F4806DRAFT_501613 [Annulohypoxylon nitens]
MLMKRQEADRQVEEAAARRQPVRDMMTDDDSLNEEIQIVEDNLGTCNNKANGAISNLSRRNGRPHEGSVERFTKLSDAHEEALCAVQTNSIETRLSRETAEKEAAEREAIRLREDVQRLTEEKNVLQDSIKTRAEQHQSALRDELEKHRKVVEKDDRLHRGAMKDLSTLYNKTLDKRREAHVDALKTLGNKHDRALEAQLASFRETLKAREKEHEASLRTKQEEHEKALEAQLAGFLETSSAKQKEHEDALKAEQLLVAQQAAQTAFEQSDKSKDQDCFNLTADLLNLSAEREELQEEHEGL